MARTAGGKSEADRRSFLYAATATAVIGVASWGAVRRADAGVPPLEDEDAVFQPLRPQEGRWYGGGRTYPLSELVDHTALAYRYDALFAV
jgi:hypothetical protein